MDLIENYLERDGVRIYYWTGGKPGAAWVVLTHGATIDHREWESTLPLLAAQFQVLVWDVRAHGKSRPARFTLKAALDDLVAILDHLRIERAVFIGHSMGGNLHQELVFHHPERVRAMVFLGCTWNFQKLSALDRFFLGIAAPIFRLYPYQTLIDQSLAATAVTKESQALLRPAIESLGKEAFAQILLETSACLHYEPGYRIGKPLLLIVGDRDQTGNIRKVMPVWAQQEPDCRLVVMPNARHAANLDDPALFNREVLAFLSGLDGGHPEVG